MSLRGLVAAAVVTAVGVSVPATAQVSLVGEWSPRYHEDRPDRIPGPELGDYTGLPITDGARLAAESWDASRLTLPEHQCKVHNAPYIYHGPLQFRMWEERDQRTQQLVAFKNYINTYEQERAIWMDGRRIAPARVGSGNLDGLLDRQVGGRHPGGHDDPHQAGVDSPQRCAQQRPVDDNRALHPPRQHSHAHGAVNDPVNLTEPLLRSEEFVLQERTAGNWLWPCEYVDEVADRPRGEVPHYLPGKSPYAGDFAWRYGVPLEAAAGGAETMYPRTATSSGRYLNPPSRRPGSITRPQTSMAGIHRVVLCAVAGVLACGAHALTQNAQRPAADWGFSGDLHTFHVQGNVHLVVGAGGNVAVKTGPDGVLFVDTGMAAHAEKLLEVVRKELSPGPIRWVVNTHAHEDHTGGNEVIGKAGSTTNDNPTPIVAHENVLTRMSLPGAGGRAADGSLADQLLCEGHQGLLLQRRAGDGLPRDHGPHRRRLGGAVPGSDVVMAGDLYLTTTYPRIDLGAGGGCRG